MAKARLMRFPVAHYTGTRSRRRGGHAGFRRVPRKIAECFQPRVGDFPRSAARWPWELRQLRPAHFLCPGHPQGNPRSPCWYAHARGNGAQLPAPPRRCLFPRHANKAAHAASLPCILCGGVGVTRSVKIWETFDAESIGLLLKQEL